MQTPPILAIYTLLLAMYGHIQFYLSASPLLMTVTDSVIPIITIILVTGNPELLVAISSCQELINYSALHLKYVLKSPTIIGYRKKYNCFALVIMVILKYHLNIKAPANHPHEE